MALKGQVRGSLVAAIFALAVILIAQPFADSGFDDDWAYAHVARVLQQTGAIHYNGWGTFLGWFQSAYGALLISIFGFSFDVLRFGTAPFAMGCAVLTYLLARRAGLGDASGIFAALVVTTSPYFIPLAASFMSDVYGMFFTELCLLCGAFALTSNNPRVWIIACTIAGMVGGTTRQSVWPAAFAALGVFAYANREQRDRFRWSTACLALCAFAAGASKLWYDRQPNREFDSLDLQSLQRFISDPSIALGATVGVLFTVMLYAAPALICFTRGIRSVGIKVVLIFLGATLFFVGFLTIIAPHAVGPWVSNMVTEDGILSSGLTLLGQRPVLLSFITRVAITAGLYFLVLLAWSIWKETAGKADVEAEGSPWPQLRTMLFAFGACYIVLIFVRANSGYTFDRYAIPLMPVVLIVLLKECARRDFRIPIAAWALAAVFAWFGIATTHDYYAQLRAREQAGKVLHRMGIPRQQITLGLENDAWTELAMRGYVSNDRAAGIAGVPVGQHPSPGQKLWWFTRHAPDIDPLYFVVAAELPELAPSGLKPIVFETWLPFGRDRLLIQKLPDAESVASVRR